MIKEKAKFERPLFWCSFVLFSTFLILQWAHGSWVSDFWEHVAALRELSINPVHPRHPIFNLNLPHAFYSPYLVLLGFINYVLGADNIDVLFIAGCINSVLIFLAFYGIVNVFSRNKNIYVFLITMLLAIFVWPQGTLEWSGFYNLNSLIYVLSYPSTFAFIISSGVMYIYKSGMEKHSVRTLSLVIVGISVVVLTHPPTATFLLISLGAISLHLLILEEGWMTRYNFQVIGLSFCVMVLAFILILAWPYYSFIELIRYGDPKFDSDSMELYLSIVKNKNMAIVALLFIPLAILNCIQRIALCRRDAGTITLLGLIGLYIIGWVVDKPGLGRVISNIHFLLALFVAEYLVIMFQQRKKRIVSLVFGFIIILFSIFLNYRNLHPYERVWRFVRGELLLRPRIHFIDRFVGETDVVLANSGLGLKIPAFAGRSVATHRPEYWVKDQAMRRDSVRKVLEENCTLQEISGVIDSYGVDFILVDTKKDHVGRTLPEVGNVLYDDGRYMLIRVRKGMGDGLVKSPLAS